MLHAMFQDHRNLGSEEEFGHTHGGHLGHVSKTIFT